MAEKILTTCWLYLILEDVRQTVHGLPISDRARLEDWLTNAAAWLALIPHEGQRIGWLGQLADGFSQRTGVPLHCASQLLQSRMPAGGMRLTRGYFSPDELKT
jgi:hypothetical protein